MSEMLTNFNGQEGLANEDYASNGFDEAMRIFSGMKDEDKQEIIAFISKIDISDPQLVERFGSKAEEANVTVCDRFLDYVTSNGGREEKEVKDAIIRLVDEVEKAAPTDEGFLGRLFLSVDQKRKRIVRKVQSVKDIIQDIKKELRSKQEDISQNIASIDEFGKNIIQNMNVIEKYVVAGEIAYKKFTDTEGKALQDKLNTASEHEKMVLTREYDTKCKEFLTRINDLKTAQSVAMVSVMQLFIMRDECKLTYNSISKSLRYTIPVWEQQCSIAIMQKKAENAAKANKSLNKATEKMLEDNVAAINAGYIDAVKSSQEGFINPEVIMKVTDDIKSTLNEVQRIEEEGLKKQRERSQLLAKGRESLIELAVSIDKDSNLSDFIRISSSNLGSSNQIEDNASSSTSNGIESMSAKLEI